MPDVNLIILTAAVFVVAVLNSSTGPAGASGYIPVRGLLNLPAS
jgi:hypothetical protein